MSPLLVSKWVGGAEGGIILGGIAGSLDRRGNPPSSHTRSEVGKSVLFVARQSIPARFIAVSNTGMTLHLGGE